MKKNIITKSKYPDVFDWLFNNLTIVIYKDVSKDKIDKFVGFSENIQDGFFMEHNKICTSFNVTLGGRKITDIPYSFGIVEGDFDCSECKFLKSLDGCPDVVNGNFYCSECVQLTSLKGCPRNVQGDFDCSGCINLKDFKYIPSDIKSLYCTDSKNITSFLNIPKTIKGDFMFSNCENIISLKGFPKYVNGDIYLTYNRFSNKPEHKEKYKLYIAMWLEVLESVSNEERKEYIINYKDKIDLNYSQPIIPIEILKEYGF